MRRVLVFVGFGLSGLALVLGLTLGASVLAGPDIRQPVLPATVDRSGNRGEKPEDPSATRSVGSVPSDSGPIESVEGSNTPHPSGPPSSNDDSSEPAGDRSAPNGDD